MLLDMTIEGFRQYKQEQRVIFTPGLNLIQGENNTGKTTLFYALEYVLFGAVQGFQGLRDLVNWDAATNRIRVALTYVANDQKKYRLMRWHEFGKRGAKGHFDLKRLNNTDIGGTDILNDGTATKEQVQELLVNQLGFTKRMFQVVINSQQGRHRAFLDGDQKLDILFGITASQKLNTLFQEYSRTLINRGTKEKEAAEKNLQRLNDQLQTANERIQNATKAKTSVQRDIDDIKVQLETLEQVNLVDVQNFVTLLDNKDRKIAVTEKSLEDAENNLTTLIEEGGSPEEIDENIAEVETQITQLDQHITGLEENNKNLLKQMSGFEGELGDLRGQLKRHLSQHGKSICEYCGSVIDSQAFQERETKLQQQISDFEDQLNKVQAEKETLQQQIQDVSKDKTTKKTEKHEFETIKKSLASLKDRVGKLTKELSEANKELEDIKGSLLESIRTVATELREVIPELTEDLVQLVKSESLILMKQKINDIHRTIDSSKAASKKDLDGKKALLEQHEQQLKTFGKDKEGIETEIHQNEQNKDKTEKDFQVGTQFEFISEGFQRFLNEQRTTLKRNLEERIRNWYTGLAAKREFSEMRIDPTNYKLSVIPVFSPTKQPVLASKYSGGGHQTLLALAYKLAVAETVGRPSVILIDEPTDGTDTQNLGNLLEHIQTLSNIFSQTFMITHHGLAQENAENIIEVTRTGGQSIIGLQN